MAQHQQSQTDSRMKAQKQRLLDELQAGGIKDGKVLDAIKAVPREAFVPRPFLQDAYENRALPIGEGQTISQPYVVALMTHAAHVQKHHKVLEIGMGSGYQAALLCKLVRRLFTIERYDNLRASAEKKLHEIGIYNFSCKTGDGSKGWPEQAPFDRIIVTAASPSVPKSLLEQLAEGGVMVIPIGEKDQEQNLVRITRTESGFDDYCLGPVKFVPLVGEEGVNEDSNKNNGERRY